MDDRAHSFWVVLLTLFVALALSVYPLPLWARWFRPDWVVIVICFWVLFLPNRVGVGVAWLTGLALDVLHGAYPGQHAFALAVVAYFVQISHQRLRMFGYRKQSVFGFSMVVIHLLLGQWVQNLVGVADISLLLLAQALMSALIWPLAHVAMTWLSYRFIVS